MLVPFQIVKVKNMTLNLEEEMICKVLKFAGITRSDDELESVDETAYDAQHALIMSTTTAKRFYFGTLKLELNQVCGKLIKFLGLGCEPSHEAFDQSSYTYYLVDSKTCTLLSLCA